MSSSSFGEVFVVTNFGESHGPAIGCVIDGCPPGMELTVEDINRELERRRPGTSRFVTQRKETDAVEILSGVYEGKTTGTPIALLIRNADHKSADYSDIAHVFRPAHADFGYFAKFGIRDPRGGGRSSARLTAPTVAAGAVAKKWLKSELGIEIRACVKAIGTLKINFEDWKFVNANPFFIANDTQLPEVESYLDCIRKDEDSVGGLLYVEALGVPAGLGNPVYNRLDAKLAYALMGLNAVKGVEIGDGFDVTHKKGSENADEMSSAGFFSNHAGGIAGGISTGAPICANVAFKPTPSIHKALRSMNEAGESVIVQTKGRHDPCVALRAAPILEALVALVLMDAVLLERAQCGYCGTEFPAKAPED